MMKSGKFVAGMGIGALTTVLLLNAEKAKKLIKLVKD